MKTKSDLLAAIAPGRVLRIKERKLLAQWWLDGKLVRADYLPVGTVFKVIDRAKNGTHLPQVNIELLDQQTPELCAVFITARVPVSETDSETYALVTGQAGGQCRWAFEPVELN